MRRLLPSTLIVTFLILSQGYSAALSLSETDLLSSDPRFNKPMWLVSVVANTYGGSGEEFVGTFDASQIYDEQTGYTAQNDFTIRVTPDKQTCNWVMRTDIPTIANTLYTPLQVEFKTTPLAFEDKDFRNSCLSHALYYYGPRESINILTTTWACVYADIQGSFGNIYFNNLGFGADVSLETSGKPTKTVSVSNEYSTQTSSVSTSAWLDNVAFVELSGSLGTGYTCDTGEIESRYKPVHISGVGWKLIEKQIYDAYVELIGITDPKQGQFYNQFIMWKEGRENNDQLVQHINDVNSVIQSITDQSKSSVSLTVPTTFIASVDSTTGTVSTSMNTLVSFPVVNMYIDAEWIGIKIPIPRPAITRIEIPSKVYTSQPEVIAVYVRNDGDDGSVEAVLSCSDMTVTNNKQNVYIQSSQTGVFKFSVTSSSVNSGSKSCTVTVYPQKDPSNKVSKSFSIQYEYKIKCSPEGYKWCSYDSSGNPIVKQCGSDGKIYTVETCGSGFVCSAGSCVKPSVPKEGFGVPLGGISMVTLSAIALIVVAIFVLPRLIGGK